MGIDYIIVNDTKKEFISGDTLHNGCCKFRNTFYGRLIPSVLVTLLSDQWKGDSIRVLDDFDQQKEFDALEKYNPKKFRKLINKILKAKGHSSIEEQDAERRVLENQSRLEELFDKHYENHPPEE